MVAMLHGHDPDAVADYAWRDLELLALGHAIVTTRATPRI